MVPHTLPTVRRVVTQELIQRYAEAVGDLNPIHIDAAFASTSPFGGVVAHGMLILAGVAEMLTLAFGPAWLESGTLRARFRAPARPGDEVTVTGELRSEREESEGSVFEYTIQCSNQRGEELIGGIASVRLPAHAPPCK